MGADRGTQVSVLLPASCGQPGELHVQRRDWDVLLTAETHNFPCAVAPYPGTCLKLAAPCHPSMCRVLLKAMLQYSSLQQMDGWARC